MSTTRADLTDGGSHWLSRMWRLVAVLGPPAAVLILGASTDLWIQRTRTERALAAHADSVITALDAVLGDLLNIETRERGYVITGDPQYIRPYEASGAALDKDIQTLRILTAHNAVQYRRVETLDGLVALRRSQMARTVEARRDRGVAAAAAQIDSDRGRQTMDAVRGLLGAINAQEHRLFAQRAADAYRLSQITQGVLIVGTALVMLLALAINAMLARYAEREAASARELASQAAQLEEQQTELEFQAEQLQAQATELEMQNEQLVATSEHLLEQRDVGEAARRVAEAAQAEAQRANAAKSRFLTAVSHDLRTPLNAIAGYVDLLELGIQGPLTEGQRGYLERLKKSQQHLLGLINDLMDLGRIEAGQLRLHLEDVPVSRILRAVDSMVTPMFGAKGIRLVWPEREPAIAVHADVERVEQILINLLTNACKFTEPGGRVWVDCAPVSEDAGAAYADGGPRLASIRIRDTGCGIADDQQAAIFEPFVQVNRQKTHQGAGLGLSIARTLARAMNGDLTVRSAIRQGATFTLTLPLRPLATAVPGDVLTPASVLTSPPA